MAWGGDLLFFDENGGRFCFLKHLEVRPVACESPGECATRDLNGASVIVQELEGHRGKGSAYPLECAAVSEWEEKGVSGEYFSPRAGWEASTYE